MSKKKAFHTLSKRFTVFPAPIHWFDFAGTNSKTTGNVTTNINEVTCEDCIKQLKERKLI